MQLPGETNYQIQGAAYEYNYNNPIQQDHTPIYEENTEASFHDYSNREKYFNNIQNVQEYIQPVAQYYEIDDIKNYNYGTQNKGYSQIYIKTPKFKLLQRQNHDSVRG